MGLILDSSVLISAERRRFDMPSFIEAEAAMEPVYIAAVTVSELLHGVHRAGEVYRCQRQAFVEAVLRNTPILPFDLICAKNHAKLWADLESEERRIGALDMLIAVTCLAFGHRLATVSLSEWRAWSWRMLVSIWWGDVT
ncbi:MAG: PIN domain-containing protein [Verrucomicrobiota bacterium]